VTRGVGGVVGVLLAALAASAAAAASAGTSAIDSFTGSVSAATGSYRDDVGTCLRLSGRPAGTPTRLASLPDVGLRYLELTATSPVVRGFSHP
jgi:hypothetical protein